MNKLKGSRFYLCGPIDRVADGGVTWRKKITPSLQQLGINVIDPTDKPIEGEENRELRKRLLKERNFKQLAKIMKEIRCIDLRCVDVSDALIVYWDTQVHMVGTIEEVVLANRQKKPILIYFHQGIDDIPDWLLGMLEEEFFFNNWTALLQYIEDINDGIITHKRWILFDYDKI